MNELWIVRFVRKDGKPDEEYYYCLCGLYHPSHCGMADCQNRRD